MARASYCEQCGTTHRPGECPMVSDLAAKCPQCGNRLDRRKRDSGHKATCPVVLALEDPRNRHVNSARPGVKIPAHKGTWRKTGRGRDGFNRPVVMWICTTCNRTTHTNGPEPTARCAEVKGK